MKPTTQLRAPAPPVATAGRASPAGAAFGAGAVARAGELVRGGEPARGGELVRATAAAARDRGEPARAPAADARDELFRAGYARHRDAIWRYLARRLHDEDLAQDLTSEVFIIAWRRRHDAPYAELPWLYGVARRVLANDRRAARSRAQRLQALASELAVAQTTEPSPGDRNADAGAGACARALAALSARDREVLMLVAWEQLEPDELATALGCRPNTARVRLHRARRRLTVLLEQHTKGTTT